MATYKVIQDIEAEDKLLGPLTLRQFVYAAMVVVMGFIAFKLATTVSAYLVIPFLLPMGFFGLLAAPFGHEQSSEIWLLAKIGFMLKPRRRIWDQSGIKQLVTITVPKKIERQLTDGLTQTEVKSRLKALANTIDSRGWAVKNVNVNLFTQAGYLSDEGGGSDRLVAASNLPQQVPANDIQAADDMLDAANNPTALFLDNMINQSAQAHRQTAVASVQNPIPALPPPDYWFMNQPGPPPKLDRGYEAFLPSPAIVPSAPPTDDSQISDDDTAEKQLSDRQILPEKASSSTSYGQAKLVSPLATIGKHRQSKNKKPEPPQPTSQEVKPDNPQKTAVVTSLAARNDLNVSTIAREANKMNGQLPDDEVVISLR